MGVVLAMVDGWQQVRWADGRGGSVSDGSGRRGGRYITSTSCRLTCRDSSWRTMETRCDGVRKGLEEGVGVRLGVSGLSLSD